MLTIRVAIPAMDELDFLPVTLDALSCQQTKFPFEVYICVNQPDDYWDNPARVSICENNRQLLDFLANYDILTLHVSDRSSPGKGWRGKHPGVGSARKVLFEQILEESAPDDLVVSLDADTWVGTQYLQSLADRFESNPELAALAVPYYHDLDPHNDTLNKAILRYEIYMRNYAINLLRIGSPYGFTALGSAIAMRAKALRKIGNITPYQSGEDFYLVQKFCKMGGLGLFNTECAHPSGRSSDRVPFGTGPAVSRGLHNEWTSYPIYSHTEFLPIADAYNRLHDLYCRKLHASENDFLLFLQKDTNQKDIWENVRQNVSNYAHFVKAFHQKADGLRILQYARSRHSSLHMEESQALYSNLQAWLPGQCPNWLLENCPLSYFTTTQLNHVRNLLFQNEQSLRKTHFHLSFTKLQPP